MKKNKIFKLCLALVAIMGGYLIYFYPVQRYLAEQNFQKYINEQDISNNNIQSKQISKDYTQGGYVIDVVYQDDPKLKYKYTYTPNRKSPYNIFLIIYTYDNVGISSSSGIAKYPPLK